MGNFISKITARKSPAPSVNPPADTPADTPPAPPATPSALKDLPYALKALVAKHLDPASKQALRRTDVEFSQAVGETVDKLTIAANDIGNLEVRLRRFPLAKTITITGANAAALAQLAAMNPATRARITHITHITRESVVVTDGAFADLAKLPNLQSLDLPFNNISNTGLARLRGLGQLRALNLSGCIFSNDDRVAELQELHSRDTDDFDFEISADSAGNVSPDLQGLTKLQSLDLSGCYGVNDATLSQLQDSPLLSSLALEGCDDIDGTGFAQLPGLTKLASLNLQQCRVINDAGIATMVASLPQLQSLKLGGGILGPNRHITDAGIAQLSGLSHLQSLELSSLRKVTETGLDKLQDLTELKSLALTYFNRIDDAMIASLPVLTQLESLNLIGCYKITPTGIAHLQSLPQFQSLDISLKNYLG